MLWILVGDASDLLRPDVNLINNNNDHACNNRYSVQDSAPNKILGK